MFDSVMDSLFDDYSNISDIKREEVIVPKRCSVCKCATVCSVLPTFIGLSKLGIYAGIEACPYFTPKKIKKDGRED